MTSGQIPEPIFPAASVRASAILLCATWPFASACSSQTPGGAGTHLAAAGASSAGGSTVPGGGSGNTLPADMVERWRGRGTTNLTMMPDAARRRGYCSTRSMAHRAVPISTASLNGAPPAIFTTACSGCHGPTGSGKGVYPSTRGDMEFSDFTALVRGGRVATDPITTASGKQIMPRMPAFSTSQA